VRLCEGQAEACGLPRRPLKLSGAMRAAACARESATALATCADVGRAAATRPACNPNLRACLVLIRRVT
jgi:hypothetical protein